MRVAVCAMMGQLVCHTARASAGPRILKTGASVMTDKPEAAEAADKGRTVRIDWQIPDGTIPQYATNMLVQHTEHEFNLFFFNLRPPLLLASSEEEALRQLNDIMTVPANLVAAITIS